MDQFWEHVQAQHGAAARWQLRAAGKSRWWLDRRLADGELIAVTNNVVAAAGAPRTPERDLMVAVLDAGPGAVATDAASGWLWGVPGFTPGSLDVIRGRGQRPAGSASAWPRHLPSNHVTSVRGIPTVTLARLFFELARDPRFARRIPRQIDTIDGRDPSLLIALHQILPEVAVRGKAGISWMRETLSSRPPDRVRLTGLERRFEWCLSSAGMVVPRRQVNLGGHSWIGRFDYFDDDIGVIYEVDSALHHASQLDRLHDAQRDREATAAGFNQVVRITEEDAWYDPQAVRQKVRDARRKWRNQRSA